MWKNDYYPFGMQMPGRKFNAAGSYRYGFNGKEKDNEISGEGNSYDFGARILDPRLGRWLSVDPLASKFAWQTPYSSMDGNPIYRIDPTGMSTTPPNEYEINGKTGEKKKISDLGGEDVDFNHYKGGVNDGKTEIVNTKTKESQWMNSSKNLKGYTRRTNETNWLQLYVEYKNGTGVEKSLIYGDQPMISDIKKSPTFKEAMQDFLESGEKKFKTAPFFNPVSAGKNMTAQFIGKANYNFYEIGDKMVIVVIDSKSVTSETFNPVIKNIESLNTPRENGKIIPESTTHQTYLFIMPTSIKKDYERTPYTNKGQPPGIVTPGTGFRF